MFSVTSDAGTSNSVFDFSFSLIFPELLQGRMMFLRRISGEESRHLQSRSTSSGSVVNIQVLYRTFSGRFVYGMYASFGLPWIRCRNGYYLKREVKRTLVTGADPECVAGGGEWRRQGRAPKARVERR